MVGLSDEAGAGANVGLAAKAQNAPTAFEAARLDDYIHSTLWGIKRDVPFNVSLQDHVGGGIRASLFWVPTPVSALWPRLLTAMRATKGSASLWRSFPARCVWMAITVRCAIE